MNTHLKEQLEHMNDTEVPEPLENFEELKIKAMDLEELEQLLTQCNYHFDSFGGGINSFGMLANIDSFDFDSFTYADEPSEEVLLLRLAAFRYATLKNDKLTLSHLLIDDLGCDKDVEHSFALLEGLADDMRAPVMDRWRAHSNLSERYAKGSGKPKNSFKASLHAEIGLHIAKNLMPKGSLKSSTLKDAERIAKTASSKLSGVMRLDVEIKVNKYFCY